MKQHIKSPTTHKKGSLENLESCFGCVLFCFVLFLCFVLMEGKGKKRKKVSQGTTQGWECVCGSSFTQMRSRGAHLKSDKHRETVGDRFCNCSFVSRLQLNRTQENEFGKSYCTTCGLAFLNDKQLVELFCDEDLKRIIFEKLGSHHFGYSQFEESFNKIQHQTTTTTTTTTTMSYDNVHVGRRSSNEGGRGRRTSCCSGPEGDGNPSFTSSSPDIPFSCSLSSSHQSPRDDEGPIFFLKLLVFFFSFSFFSLI